MPRIPISSAKRSQHPGDDTIPAEVWELLDAAKGVRSWAQLARDAGAPSSNLHVGTRTVGRERLQRFAAAVQGEPLAQLAGSDVWWDRIVDITYDGVDQVYDVTVPGDHNFVAADLFVHNTAACAAMPSANAVLSRPH